MLDTPGDITTQTPDDTARTTLERVEPGEARKTLGIYIAMYGNQQQQKEYLRDKGLEFADAYRVSHCLEKNDAWQGVMSTIMSTFKYPAMATTLSYEE